jgi:hypothetical protein
MSFGNLGAGSGAQPAAQPVGAPVFANQGGALSQGTTAAGPVMGQAGNPAPNGATPYYNASFESIMAAVSRGEIPLNQQVIPGGPFGGVGPQNNQQGNPTLLQAISQGVPQNGTNGIGVVAGYGIGAGNGPGVVAVISGNGGLGSPVVDASGCAPSAFGGTQAIDAKQMENAVPQVAASSTTQYGGN